MMETLNSLPLIEPNQANLRTFEPQNVVFRGKQIELKSNPIFRCNYFLMCYNASINKINGISLSLLPRNRIYYSLYPILGLQYLLLHLLLNCIPYVNLVWSIFLISMWIIYERAHIIYRSNNRKISNPLKRMIYNPDLCKRYRCMNKFLEVPSSILGDISVEGNTEKISIMIYNDNFRKMHSQFPYYRYLHLFHIMLSILLIFLSYVCFNKALGINILSIPDSRSF